jgi:plastocyanin
MRSHALWLGAFVSALVLATAMPAEAEEPAAADHSARDHIFVTILPLKLRPDVQHLGPGDAVGWINYTNRIARVYFAKDVAKRMTCTSKGTFRINGERLESADIQAQQFASLCSLAPGEYAYRVELRSGVGGGSGGGGGVTATLEGKIVAE